MHRAVNLCHKFCDGKVTPLQNEATDPWAGLSVPFDLDALRAKVEGGMETFSLKVRCWGTMGCSVHGWLDSWPD